jgi:hypothetical protein
VVTSGTTTSPLKDDREIGVGGGDCDDLTRALDLNNRDMSNTGSLETTDDLCSPLGTQDTRSDAESFHGYAFMMEFLPERKLEAELAWVDVECPGQANARKDIASNTITSQTDVLGPSPAPGLRDVHASCYMAATSSAVANACFQRGDRKRCACCL